MSPGAIGIPSDHTMKRHSIPCFLAFALLCATSISAQITFYYSSVASTSGTDTYGLDGATLTYSFSTTSSVTVDNGGSVNAPLGAITLAISGSDVHDGSYTLTQTYDSGYGSLGTTPVVYFSGTTVYLPLAAPAFVPIWLSDSGFTMQSGYVSGTLATTYGAGDTLDPADFSDLSLTPRSFTFSDGLGAVSYSLSATTLNATAAVPEPGTLAALGGLAGLVLVSRRRRRQ